MELEIFVGVFFSSVEAPWLFPTARLHISCAGVWGTEFLFCTHVSGPQFSTVKWNAVPTVVLTGRHQMQNRISNPAADASNLAASVTHFKITRVPPNFKQKKKKKPTSVALSLYANYPGILT
jgi:hypothetical protein